MWIFLNGGKETLILVGSHHRGLFVGESSGSFIFSPLLSFSLIFVDFFPCCGCRWWQEAMMLVV